MKCGLLALIPLVAFGADAPVPLRFELKRVEMQTTGCVVTFEYPEIISAATPQARDRINAGILRVLLRRNEWPAPDSGFRSLHAYANDFMQECAKSRTRPETRELYEHKRVTIFRYTPPILSFRCDSDEDAGGAHPFGTTFFVNFDSSTGKAIAIADLLKDGAFPKLEALAEANFRRKYESFPVDRFRLNDNFGIGEEQLVFFFNRYEIGPGAMGATEIEMPYPEIRNLLRVDLRSW